VRERVYHYQEGNKMTNLREIFAHNLRKYRKNSGLSQEKLAEKVSVSTHHIAMIEIARNYPALELVERIANVLDIELYELFINPLSPPEEMERLYQTVAKNIEQVVYEAIEKNLINKCVNIKNSD
jgi:transcriptional regulator with XRE-family HTH domain